MQLHHVAFDVNPQFGIMIRHYLLEKILWSYLFKLQCRYLFFNPQQARPGKATRPASLSQCPFVFSFEKIYMVQNLQEPRWISSTSDRDLARHFTSPTTTSQHLIQHHNKLSSNYLFSPQKIEYFPEMKVFVCFSSLNYSI